MFAITSTYYWIVSATIHDFKTEDDLTYHVCYLSFIDKQEYAEGTAMTNEKDNI